MGKCSGFTKVTKTVNIFKKIIKIYQKKAQNCQNSLESTVKYLYQCFSVQEDDNSLIKENIEMVIVGGYNCI